MALTAEQQATLDAQNANQLALETYRVTAQEALEAKRAKIEAIRVAKEVLTENNRSKPVDSRELSSSDITNFAKELLAFINE